MNAPQNSFDLGGPSFDMDKSAAAASRKRVLGMVAADRMPLIGYPMPFPAVGHV